MPRTVQTLHYIQDQVVGESSVRPTSPIALNGRVEGLSRLIVIDLLWAAKVMREPQTYEGVGTSYRYNAASDEHLFTITAKNGTYVYVMTPAQFKAKDGGLLCFLGTLTRASGDAVPGGPAFSYDNVGTSTADAHDFWFDE